MEFAYTRNEDACFLGNQSQGGAICVEDDNKIEEEEIPILDDRIKQYDFASSYCTYFRKNSPYNKETKPLDLEGTESRIIEWNKQEGLSNDCKRYLV